MAIHQVWVFESGSTRRSAEKYTLVAKEMDVVGGKGRVKSSYPREDKDGHPSEEVAKTKET